VPVMERLSRSWVTVHSSQSQPALSRSSIRYPWAPRWATTGCKSSWHSTGRQRFQYPTVHFYDSLTLRLGENKPEGDIAHVKQLWQRWLKVTETVGTIQMIIFLSVVYWIFLMPMALLFKLLTDPLALEQPQASRWVRHRPLTEILESMRNQF